MHHRTPNLTGQTFGRLTVVGYAGSDGKKSHWTVRCECGAEKTVVGSELRKGKTNSCGCLRLEMVKKPRSHGMSYQPQYATWRAMVDRCRLPSHKAYARYGGRGITVCPEWDTFEKFWEDMGPTYVPGLSLDRIDNNAGYSKDNCRWTDRKTQSRNKRNNRMIDTPKGRMLICEASDVSGINVTTLCYRLGAGWPTERLFDPPDFTNRVE